MIVSVILADRTEPLIGGKLPYELPAGSETVIERVARTVLRGPFGGTIVVAPASHIGKLKPLLEGFAVHWIDSGAGPAELGLEAGLHFATVLRERWEQAMSRAAAQFSVSDREETAKSREQK